MGSALFISLGLFAVLFFFSVEMEQPAGVAAARALIHPHPTPVNLHPDPTDGFTEMPLNSSNFLLHKPYDKPACARYTYDGDVHKFWVFSTDKPLAPSSPTFPRSEMRVKGYDYSSGIWQFEGQGYVPKGTTGVCVMQVFGGCGHPTTLMLKVYNSSLIYYKAPVVAKDIYDRWFRLNVIHDADAQKLQIFIEGQLVKERLFPPNVNCTLPTHWFQFGVYMQDNLTDYMESRWKGIKVLNKNSLLS